MGQKSPDVFSAPPGLLASPLPGVFISRPSVDLVEFVDHYKVGTISGPPDMPVPEMPMEVFSLPSLGTEIVATSEVCMDEHHPDAGLVAKPQVFFFGSMSKERGASLSLRRGVNIGVVSVVFKPGAPFRLFKEHGVGVCNQVLDAGTWPGRTFSHAERSRRATRPAGPNCVG